MHMLQGDDVVKESSLSSPGSSQAVLSTLAY